MISVWLFKWEVFPKLWWSTLNSHDPEWPSKSFGNDKPYNIIFKETGCYRMLLFKCFNTYLTRKEAPREYWSLQFCISYTKNFRHEIILCHAIFVLNLCQWYTKSCAAVFYRYTVLYIKYCIYIYTMRQRFCKHLQLFIDNKRSILKRAIHFE